MYNETRRFDNNKGKAKDALNTCVRKISDRKLQMNIVKAEYTFDSSKIIFTFTLPQIKKSMKSIFFLSNDINTSSTFDTSVHEVID